MSGKTELACKTHRSVTFAAIFAQFQIVPNLRCAVQQMVLYCVYKATFYTHRGSRRCYIGMTGNRSQRELDLQTVGDRQPAWLKAGCDKFQHAILVDSIPSRAAALATEALMTAREWRKASDAVRGWEKKIIYICVFRILFLIR